MRVTGLAGRKGEARAEVTLARCRIQRARSNCNPMEGRTQRLDEEGRARFPRIEGGFYNLVLRRRRPRARRAQTVEVASDGDLPALIVEVAIGEWTLRGTTRLHDGTPRPARVTSMEFVNGIGEDTAAETRSAADGSFELKVISRAGNAIGLKAESDDPHAVAAFPKPVKLDEATRTVEDIVIELDATALEVTVRDARSGRASEGLRDSGRMGEGRRDVLPRFAAHDGREGNCTRVLARGRHRSCERDVQGPLFEGPRAPSRSRGTR